MFFEKLEKAEKRFVEFENFFETILDIEIMPFSKVKQNRIDFAYVRKICSYIKKINDVGVRKYM